MRFEANGDRKEKPSSARTYKIPVLFSEVWRPESLPERLWNWHSSPPVANRSDVLGAYASAVQPAFATRNSAAISP